MPVYIYTGLSRALYPMRTMTRTHSWPTCPMTPKVWNDVLFLRYFVGGVNAPLSSTDFVTNYVRRHKWRSEIELAG